MSVVIVAIVISKDIVPPMVLDTRGFLFGDLVAGNMPPALDFLCLFGTRLASVLDKIILIRLNNFHDFLVDDGGAFAIARLMAGRKPHKCHCQ